MPSPFLVEARRAQALSLHWTDIRVEPPCGALVLPSPFGQAKVALFATLSYTLLRDYMYVRCQQGEKCFTTMNIVLTLC
jgi:hypothetical protein